MRATPIDAYLDSLRQHDHIPGPTGTVTIGRTTYSAGSFVTPPRPISPGCRAYQDGERFTAATERIAVVSESLPPASRRPVVYVDQHGTEWYVSGWTTKEATNVFWLDKVTYPEIFLNRDGDPIKRVGISVSFIPSAEYLEWAAS